MSEAYYNLPTLELMKRWYEYVSVQHHKDRDCHWYIEVDYAYGDPPTYIAMHQGYVYDGGSGKERTTYAEAEQDLRDMVLDAIREQRAWATQVRAEGEPEWDELQVKQANRYFELFDAAELQGSEL